MKKVYSLLMGLAMVAGFTACSDDEEQFTLNTEQSGDITLSPESASFVVTETNQENLAERFNWNQINMDLPVALTYTLQMDKTDGDYSSPYILGQSSGSDVPITYGQINEAALALDGENGIPATYKARVAASTNDPAVSSVFSNEISITITPFVGYPYDPLYFVGAASPLQEWNNGDGNGGINPPLFINPDNKNKFSFTGRFSQDFYKILPQLGAWQPQYGTRGPSNPITLNDGGNEPEAFSVPATGYYRLNIDITGVTGTSTGNGSYELAAYPAGATAQTYTSIGMLGSSFPTAPFDTQNDFNMEPFRTRAGVNFDPHLWVARNVTVTGGEMKFRANDSWDTNWGNNTVYTGKAPMNGPNVPTVAGTYDIFFSDLDGSYIFLPVE